MGEGMNGHGPHWSENAARAAWARGQDGTNATAPDVGMTDEVSAVHLSMALWTREVVSRGLQHVQSTSWATEARDLPEGDFNGRHNGNREALYVDTAAGPAVTRLYLEGGRVYAWVAARDVLTVESRLSWARAALPVLEVDQESPRVPVTFWSLGPHGPVSRTRAISVPAWEDVQGNYAAGVAEQVGALASDRFQPGVGGQLLLWHGPPGTGKTYALRALAWEWRAWADVHYVTDPEEFFGARAAYMLDVLLHDHDDGPVAARLGGSDFPDDEPAQPKIDPRAADGRWKLLVLEDTGELMSADARDRSGQGLSRLLNVVDGLIGQGLRVLVLVTTNEELKTLHPAVQRPGRCASKVLFGPLGSLEAEEWLRARGVERQVFSATPVADLFAMLEERETTADRGRAPVGFAS